MPRWAVHIAPPGEAPPADARVLCEHVESSVRVLVGGAPPLRTPKPASAGAKGMGPRIEIARDGSILRLSIPLISDEPVFCRRGPGGVSLVNDPRLLVAPGDLVSAKGLIGLLAMGALLPPFSLWREIKQLPPGFTYAFSLRDLGMTRFALPPILNGNGGSPSSLDDRVLGALDEAVAELVPNRCVKVLFSGGIDSSLVAARLAAAPGHDIELVHCQTEPSSVDTEYARAIAQELRLPMRIVPYDEARGLEECARQLPAHHVPSGDFSTVALLQMLAVLADDGLLEGTSVVDGSGADGAFRSARATTRLAVFSRLPRPLFALAWQLYTKRQLWKSPHRRSGDLLRALAKFGKVGGFVGSISYQPVPFIDHSDGSVYQEIEREVGLWMGEVGVPAALRYPVFLLIANRTGNDLDRLFRFAEDHGSSAALPFMHPTVLKVALSDFERRRWWDAETKGPLKRLLTRHVSGRLVHRPKLGFSFAPANTFAHPLFLGMLDEVLEDGSSPVLQVVPRAELVEMRRWLEARRPVGWYTYAFVWTCVNTHRWMAHRPEVA